MATQIPLAPPSLASRFYGCWLGKSVGGTLGIPAEGVQERLHLTFYDPVPTEAPPNDDLELQLVWLHLLETTGLNLTQQDFADAWREHIHYMWDEYGRTRWNLRRGVPLPEIGTWENPFHAGMGSPIRSEIWACVAGGSADIAARYAALDASLDHGPEGIAGEVYFAVLQTLVLAGGDVQAALRQAADWIDPRTETARALALVGESYGAGTETWACRDLLIRAHGSDNFTHAPLNVGLTVWALLYGAGDFEKSILLAVNGGYDTDCTGATVGATLGLHLGQDGIPARWVAPIGDGVAVGPGIVGIRAPRTLGELTDRTLALAETLAKSPPVLSVPAPAAGNVRLADLPGTLELRPSDGSPAVLWANGEMPDAAKSAGGAAWQWHAGTEIGRPHHVMALAKDGARLFVDDVLLVDCPPGLPFVPTPHRCPSGSQAAFTPTKAVHAVRLELASSSPVQAASVLLSLPNFHLTAWTNETLLFLPLLEPRAQ